MNFYKAACIEGYTGLRLDRLSESVAFKIAVKSINIRIIYSGREFSSLKCLQ